tara:strand:+ start:1189 stop:1794 length:606 start_codon:yes stop_codon:yes gene_type:complete
MKTKIAVFDYCETLVDMQTGNNFISYYFLINSNIIKRLAAYFFCNLRIFKKKRKFLLLYLLSGESQSDIENAAHKFVDNRLINAENTKVIEQIKNLDHKGFKLVIISAGYKVYIDKHNERLNVDLVIANELSYVNKICTGKLTQKDCYGENKIERLKDAFPGEVIDYENSYFYSDCMSDLPLFKKIGNSFLVTKNNITKFC